jgi:hypothetical protein
MALSARIQRLRTVRFGDTAAGRGDAPVELGEVAQCHLGRDREISDLTASQHRLMARSEG